MNQIQCVAELPAGELMIYGSGTRAQALLDSLRFSRPDIAVAGFLDSFNAGSCAGLEVQRFDQYLEHGGARSVRVVVASFSHQEICEALQAAGVQDIWVYEALELGALAMALFRHGPPEMKVTVLDLGARREEGRQEWERQLPPERVRVYGFEPAAEACREAQQELDARGIEGRISPLGIWGSKGVIPFYMTDPPTNSSCFPLNTRLVERLRNSRFTGTEPYRMLPAGVCQIAVDTLDNWWSEGVWSSPDFAKLDIHGAELEALQGGRTLLDELVGIKCEVWFAEYYIGAPRYSEVELFLRERGFSYCVLAVDYSSYCFYGKKDAPLNSARLRGYPAHGPAIASDAMFFRDPLAMDLEELGRARFFTPEKMAALVIMCEACTQYEYAFELMQGLPELFRALGREQAAQWFEAARQEALAKYRAFEY